MPYKKESSTLYHASTRLEPRRLNRAMMYQPIDLADLHRLLGAYERTAEGRAWLAVNDPERLARMDRER